MKQRFSSLDVKVIAHELSASLVSLRLANIYDLNTRIFLLKFAKPDHREQLLVDSGFRCHLTHFSRATAAAPSPFVARLRKFIRTRRVTSVTQVGTDRIIEIQFSDGNYRLFLEFYAGGNVVLTDGDLTTLALLRTVAEGAEHEQYRLGAKYDLSLRQNYGRVPFLDEDRLRAGLQRALERQQAEAEKPGKKIKKKPGDNLRKALAITTTEFPPILLDHALHVTGFDRETPVEDVIGKEEVLEKLLASLQEAQRVVEEITSRDTAKGYILAKPGKPREGEDQQSNLMYDDFHPFKPAQLSLDPNIKFLEHEGFNQTVDEFFSSIEGQKLESRLQEREDHAKKRIEQARDEQAKRIEGLQQVQELNVRKAQAIEANVERVEEAVAAVNGLIAQGMDWGDVQSLIENEQRRHNPVAEMIKLPLKLHENTVTLLLSEFDAAGDEDMADETDSEASDDEEEPTNANGSASKSEDKRLAVDVDLAESAWSNARRHYDEKRVAAVKQEKTAQASVKALKSTEQKVMADLKKGLKQEKDVLRPVRKQMWFEKFIYFISSDGYLVLAGKDAQQNEILYRRYLKKGDVYLHADLHGAASVIIKNNPSTPEAVIPPSTLAQAGNLAVCTSSAWDSKAGMSAWWVNADQVSKTAPTGEYLTTGGFMIRGKKNFLPPAQLLLGFALAFQISEESKSRHLKHRLRDKPAPASGGRALSNGDANPGPDVEEDEDDEFPDAAAGSAGHGGHGDDDDDDDDFPDTHDDQVHDNGDDDGDDDGDEPSNPHDERDEEDYQRGVGSNPLQMGGNKGEKDASDTMDEDDSAEDDEEEAQDDEAADESTEAAKASQSTKNDGTDAQKQNVPVKKAAPKVRGKKGKAKKAAKKYADQDEEDRELAMKILGSRAEEKRQAEEVAKTAKTESNEEARARRRAQHEKAQKEGLEAEEIRRLNLEEGVEPLDEEEAASLTQLDALVGTPLPGDEILEVIPVCAPWNALTKYKYKAKMQPGQQKKGKAIREILGKWTKDVNNPKIIDLKSEDNEKIWPREADLIKGLKEVEVVGIVPVKSMRIMSAGGSAGPPKGKGGRGGKGGGRGRGKKK